MREDKNAGREAFVIALAALAFIGCVGAATYWLIQAIYGLLSG